MSPCCSATRTATSTPTLPRSATRWCSCAPCCRASRSMKSTPCSAAPSRARPSATGISSATSPRIRSSNWCMPTASAAWSWRCSRCRRYPLVFKLIRDQFAYPKDIAREEVLKKYQLVFKHDRVGRLIDAQEYRHLRFPRAQFAPALLEELLGECSESVSSDGDDIVVHHCYVERRLRPLNLYVKEVPEDVALARDPGLRPGDQGPGAQQHLPRRPAAEEFRRRPATAARSSTTTTSCAWSATAGSASCPSRATTRKKCTTAPGITWPTTMCSRSSSRASSA